MEKLSLKNLPFTEKDLLSREHLKNVVGSGLYCDADYHCPDDQCCTITHNCRPNDGTVLCVAF